MDREVVGVRRGVLVAPEDPDLVAAERDDRRDVVDVHGGSPRHRERRAPGGVGTGRPVDPDRAPGLPRRPQLTGRILGDDQGLAANGVDRRGEPAIERIGVCRAVVAEPQEPGDTRPVGLAEVVRRDVQLGSVPQHVRPGAASIVDACARPRPGVGRLVQLPDVDVERGGVVHARPPLAVVEPELGLGLRPTRGATWTGMAFEADVAGIRRRGGRRRKQESKAEEDGADPCQRSTRSRCGRPGQAGRLIGHRVCALPHLGPPALPAGPVAASYTGILSVHLAVRFRGACMPRRAVGETVGAVLSLDAAAFPPAPGGMSRTHRSGEPVTEHHSHEA